MCVGAGGGVGSGVVGEMWGWVEALSPPHISSCCCNCSPCQGQATPAMTFLKSITISFGPSSELPLAFQTTADFVSGSSGHQFPLRSPLSKAFLSHGFSSRQSKSSHETSFLSPRVPLASSGLGWGGRGSVQPAIPLSASTAPGGPGSAQVCPCPAHQGHCTLAWEAPASPVSFWR